MWHLSDLLHHFSDSFALSVLQVAEAAGVDMEAVTEGKKKLGAEMFRRGALGGRRSSKAAGPRISAADAVQAMWGGAAADGAAAAWGDSPPPRRSSMQLPKPPSNLG